MSQDRKDLEAFLQIDRKRTGNNRENWVLTVGLGFCLWRSAVFVDGASLEKRELRAGLRAITPRTAKTALRGGPGRVEGGVLMSVYALCPE